MCLLKNIVGIEHFIDADALLRSCQHIFESSTSVGIISGFCIPPTETDGPLGTLSMVKSLLFLQKKVTIITDEANEKIVCGALAHYGFTNSVKLVVFPNANPDNVEDNDLAIHLSKKVIEENKLDHLVCFFFKNETRLC